MIRFACPGCGQHYKTEDDLIGEELQCNKCAVMITVPDADNIPPTVNADAPPVHDEPIDSKRTQELKMPPIGLPETYEKKMQECRAERAAERAAEKAGDACPSCGATLQSKTAIICTECGQNVKLGLNVNTVKNAKAAGKFGMAIGVGAAAALLSGAIWAWIAVSIRMEIGYVACLVGFITGLAVCMVTKERSSRVGAMAVMLACVGLLAGKMLTAEFQIRDMTESLTNITKQMSKVGSKMGKQFRDMALMGMLSEEMRESGEITNPYDNEKLKKLAPKDWSKQSKEYKAANEKARKEFKQNQAKVKKKFASLLEEDKVRLQKKLDRMMLIFPLQQEMIEKGEIPKPDDAWKDLAPKSFKEKPSKEYLESLKKYTAQVSENMKVVKKKLYALSDAEAERLKGKIGSSFSSQFSYWQKLKMVTSYWDILWCLLAISTAWGLGTGTSSLSRQGM